MEMEMEFNNSLFMQESQFGLWANSGQVDTQTFSDFDCIDVLGRNKSQSDLKVMSDETAMTLCRMNIALWDVMPPLYLLLGTVTNALSIAIWSKQKLAQQTQHVSTLLLWLAIFDLAVLYTALIKHYLKKSQYRLDIQEASDATCKLHEFLIYVSLSCSSWIVAFIAVDRCTTVLCLHPQVKNLTVRVRGRLSARRPTATVLRRPASLHLAVVGLVATCLVANTHIFWTQKQADEGGCRSAIEHYASFLLDVRPKFDLLFAGVLPIVVVIVSTLLLVFTVCCCHRKTVACCSCRTRGCAKNTQAQGQTCRGASATPSAVSKMSNRITWTLISIAICFIICNVPARVYLMLYPSLPSDANDDPGKYFKHRFTFSVLVLLQFLANVVNFFIYSVGNELFRKELRKILFKYCTLAHR